MEQDIRDTEIYREAEALYKVLRQPGAGRISDVLEVHVAPDGQHAVFSGAIVASLEGVPTTRICRVDLRSGATQVLTFGPNTDRLAKYAPEGARVAFLSDRNQAGDFQLYLLDLESGAASATAAVDGWVEYLHWSPDGRRILLGVAGHGADISGGQGAVASKQSAKDIPSWIPAVETGDECFRWRRLWVYDLATQQVRRVGPENLNAWEAVWCGDDAIAVVASPGPGEGLWYSASLHIFNLKTGGSRELYKPGDQLGWPAACAAGTHLAVVEAVCSDRWIVAGNLLLLSPSCGAVQRIDTHGVDISYTEWRSQNALLLAGHRDFDSVVGLYDVRTNVFTEVWVNSEITAIGRFISVSGLNEKGDCVLAGEGFLRAPEIGLISAGRYRSLKTFDVGYANEVKAVSAVEQLTWTAPDGLQIQGWLLRPQGNPPYALVMCVHGGPVWHWRSLWLGRSGAPFLMLLKRGYSIFLPNPRGSTGRGLEFVRHVQGDMGGADTYDCLSGLDHLVERGIADAHRLGVTGGSYGGFLAAWLITQDSRFAAAVPVAPVTNHVTAQLISNIPHFVALFMADRYSNPGGKYFQRSPIMHAHKVKTPTLSVCGTLDRCTPPEEAMQFHNALLENGVRSVLLNYPEEGHGIRKWPAAIDYAARLVAWFEEHMPGGDQSP